MAAQTKPFRAAGSAFTKGFWFNAVLLRAYQHLLKHSKEISYISSFAACIAHALQNNKNEDGLMTGRVNRTVDMVNQAGMLEILARLAYLEKNINSKQWTDEILYSRAHWQRPALQ